MRITLLWFSSFVFSSCTSRITFSWQFQGTFVLLSLIFFFIKICVKITFPDVHFLWSVIQVMTSCHIFQTFFNQSYFFIVSYITIKKPHAVFVYGYCHIHDALLNSLCWWENLAILFSFHFFFSQNQRTVSFDLVSTVPVMLKLTAV